MPATPSPEQNFQVNDNEGPIMIDVDFQSMQVISCYHDIFDAPGNNIIEKHQCNSVSGSTITPLNNPASSYHNLHLATTFQITDVAGDESPYKIKMTVYQQNNTERSISFNITGNATNNTTDGVSVNFI